MPKRKRVKRSIQARATHVRCGWCGKTFKITKQRRTPKHKADRDWEYRDDDLCPGSDTLVKHFPAAAFETQRG